MKVVTPLAGRLLTHIMGDNRNQEIEFTSRDSSFTREVRIAKATQQQAGVGEFIAMGLQVVNVIDETTATPPLEVGMTFTYDGKLWEIKEPTVIGADAVNRSALAVTSI